MKEFLKIMGPYFKPYKGYIIGTFTLNILTAIFNVFSFTLLVPILHILFNIEDKVYAYMPFSEGSNIKETIDNFIDIAQNNGF